jgi:hypothetical protein
MSRYAIQHRTHYRYARPVELGVHRLMVRPKDSHDLRLEDATLTLSPHADVRWSHDVFGNSIARVTFSRPTDELLIESHLEVTRYSLGASAIEIDDSVRHYPFVYAPDERLNLGPFLNCGYAHCQTAVLSWAHGFVQPGIETLDLLRSLNQAIRANFSYAPRPIAGVQTPSETLRIAGGTCRDFATLFIEAARALGIGARLSPAISMIPRSIAGTMRAWSAPVPPTPGPRSICRGRLAGVRSDQRPHRIAELAARRRCHRRGARRPRERQLHGLRRRHDRYGYRGHGEGPAAQGSGRSPARADCGIRCHPAVQGGQAAPEIEDMQQDEPAAGGDRPTVQRAAA